MGPEVGCERPYLGPLRLGPLQSRGVGGWRSCGGAGPPGPGSGRAGGGSSGLEGLSVPEAGAAPGPGTGSASEQRRVFNLCPFPRSGCACSYPLPGSASQRHVAHTSANRPRGSTGQNAQPALG